jgi:hypothetical protein
MSKRPLPNTSQSTSEPNRKKSSFRFARDPSEVVANSTRVGQKSSGRVNQTKQNIPGPSVSSSTIAPLPQDQLLQLDDQISIDAIDQDIVPDVLSKKPKRKKRTNTTSVSNNMIIMIILSKLLVPAEPVDRMAQIPR